MNSLILHFVMKWTFENFKTDLDDLDPRVREKALEIANNLMEKDDYSEERAIEEAIKEAEEWFLDRQG
ncbi:MAG TPA: hypothetical protein VFG39_04475 [Balneolaceae bacterium]|nr:hypothetical protein [Balneolaceae bacterium]